MKKINSKWYSIEKIKFIKHQCSYIKDPNGYLYVNSQYNTKIRAEDLPEWFVYGRFYKRFGYLSAKGVVDALYVPNKIFNHMFKDDYLIISYNKKINRDNNNTQGLADISEQFLVPGRDIISMLKAIRKYSGIDINPIIEQIKDKQQWFKEKYPYDYEMECGDFDVDECFKE